MAPLLSQAQFSIQRNTMLKGLEKTYDGASVLILDQLLGFSRNMLLEEERRTEGDQYSGRG